MVGLEVPAGIASAVYELEMRERRFRSVFESTLDAIVIFDDTGRVLDANSAAATLFGVEPRDLPGRNLEAFCDGLSGQPVLAGLRSAGRLRCEFEVVRPGGARRIVEASLTADFVYGQHVGVLRDVTEQRRHAQERLRLAERFERLFRTDLVGMTLINRQTGRVEDCNGKLAEFFGRRPEDFIGRHVTEFEDFFVSRERYQRLLLSWASGSPLRGLALQSARPDGTRRQGLATFETIPGVDGEIAMDVALLIDVTEQHRLETELRQAQRLEAIGRLAGGIAHEFNNLLAVISGFAALLEPTVKGDPDGQDSVAEIKRASNRAVKLVYGLLAFSKQKAFELGPVDLHALIRRSAVVLQEQLGPQVRIEFKLNAPSPWVTTDALQFEHALQQLAANAHDAMPDGGTFTIETAEVDHEVRLSVGDTGTGMDPVTLERAFEPFFTTKPLGTGPGLGLSMVYGVITQSGGRIMAQSEPTKGTTMDLYLSLASPAPASAAPADPLNETHAVGGTETILLVESDTSVALLIESFFTRLGYRVICVPTEQEALHLSAAEGDRIDLVIMHPSDASIDAAVGALRAHRERLPVIMVADTAAGNGPATPDDTTLLTRPFAMADLAGVARTLLDRA